MKRTLLLIALLTASLLAQEGLSYEKTTVAKLAAGQVQRTRAEVSGTVTLVKHEADGDLHIRVSDGKVFIVAECMPKLPCAAPKVGQKITVGGITRFDAQHKFWEIHPVEYVRVAQ